MLAFVSPVDRRTELRANVFALPLVGKLAAKPAGFRAVAWWRRRERKLFRLLTARTLSIGRNHYGAISAFTWVSLSVAPLPVLPKIVTMQSPAFTSTGTEKMVSTWF